MELTPRKQKILSAVVESYIHTGEPVGSKALLNEAKLDVSSATVRNEMADLTNKGFLIQPHTSAGRVPTQQGYRYYIDNIMSVTPVSASGKEFIESKLYQSADSPESILKKASELASELTNMTAVTTTPNGEQSRIHKIRFVQTGSHTAMAVVIVSNGIIKSKLFRCDFVITPEILAVFDKALNETFSGIKLSSVNRPFIQTAAARFGELSLFMPDVLMAIKEACDSARDVSIFLSGQTKLLFAPDVNFLTARNVMEFLNNQHDLAAMLENLPLDASISIGSENNRVELANSSVISIRYDIDNTPSGVIAVIGHIRIDYPRVMSILECISDCVSTMIGELVDI
ncbi:MAG: heat-inducible transcriptional repressor HrcA [Ruminococcus sp.]|nr:heat-inducible transcriptional repressor HrcA [Ruminococcus sp.]